MKNIKNRKVFYCNNFSGGDLACLQALQYAFSLFEIKLKMLPWNSSDQNFNKKLVFLKRNRPDFLFVNKKSYRPTRVIIFAKTVAKPYTYY